MRERNITWLLNLGVILLLIGGLFVATSNWESMTNLMKAASIGLVSGLFFGMAVMAKKVLKIEQTAFAFLILGSLFLPIFLLSLGWFQLLGTYLAFTGEGRYVFGMLSGYVLVPIYIYLAKVTQSRLFVWFSCISATIATVYLLTAFHLERDLFYFGMILYHGCLILIHHYCKKKPNLKLFTNELLPFFQVSLILTTAFMLLLFNDHMYYGFNIILAAIMYLAMVYVTGQKNYHFVFSIFIVYGVYQLVEYSVLQSISPVIYAIVGTFFLALPFVLGGQLEWKRIFSLTSAIVSLLVFFYISIESFLLYLGNPSWVMVVSYVILSANFFYLATTLKKQVFSYVTSAFLAAALFEGMLVINKVIHFESLLPFFFIGFVLFLFFGYAIRSIIRVSARDIGIGIMVLPIAPSMIMSDFWEAAAMLLLIAVSFFVVKGIENRTVYRQAIDWIIPIGVGLSVTSFCEQGRIHFPLLGQEAGVASNFLIGSLILFAKGRTNKPFYLISHSFYLIGMIYSLTFPMNDVLRVLILSVGIYMAYNLYKTMKEATVSYYVSSTAAMAYLSLLYAIDRQLGIVTGFEEIKWVIGAVLLVGAAFVLKRLDRILANSFMIIGHFFLLGALMVSLFLYGNDAWLSFLIVAIVYAASVKIYTMEWTIRSFLYGCYITLFVGIRLFFIHYDYSGDYTSFSFLLTSVIIGIWWGISHSDYKVRTSYFLVPFSILGLLAFLMHYPFELLTYVSLLVYGVGVLFLLHRSKWNFIVFFPLIIMLASSIQYSLISTMTVELKTALFVGLGLAAFLAGRLLYENIFISNPKLPFRFIDAYSLISLFFFLFVYTLDNDTLWLSVLPGLLICFFLWMQQNRVSKNNAWIPRFLAGGYLLQPYYSFLDQINIHELFVREFYVLPFIGIGVFLQTCVKDRYAKLASYIQWLILIGVSLSLVQDGLQSNTVYDAIIVGTLALVSILVGALLRIKSYFFVGSGVLLLNVLLQTRPYWGNLPWWAYLLLAGSILIAVASYNEWNKQKRSKGEATFLSKIKKSIQIYLKSWK